MNRLLALLNKMNGSQQSMANETVSRERYGSNLTLKARPLLKDEKRKVSVVAAEVGYGDETHFIKTFKKWTGVSPAPYSRYPR